MIKHITILFLALCLSACMYQSVSSTDIKNAEIICKATGENVVSIHADFLGGEEVTCTNDRQYFINSSNIEKAREMLAKGESNA